LSEYNSILTICYSILKKYCSHIFETVTQIDRKKLGRRKGFHLNILVAYIQIIMSPLHINRHMDKNGKETRKKRQGSMRRYRNKIRYCEQGKVKDEKEI